MSLQDDLVAKGILNGVTLNLYSRSCLDVHADAVVNAANERLEHGGGIAGEILRRAGQALTQESRQWINTNGQLIPGSVAVTSSANLQPFKLIIHCVGPKDEASAANNNMLVSTLVNGFKEASRRGCQSISVPGLSCGIFGFPKEVSAMCHFHSFVIFASQSAYYPKLTTINLCLFTEEETDIFANEMINQCEVFHEFEYFGTTKEKGTSINNSFCKLCQSSLGIDIFTLFACCRDICDFCAIKSNGNTCFSCNSLLSDNARTYNRCKKCLVFYHKNEGHSCQ